MNQAVCEMVGNDFLAQYKVSLEAIVLIAVLVAGLFALVRRDARKDERVRVALIVLPAVLFMGIFAWSEYIATATDVFEINLYALFTLPIFVLTLTIAITSYGTFKLGQLATRVLFYIFLVLAATQFIAVNDLTEFLLAAMSFGVVLTLGIMLFFASEREMKQRIKIEEQSKELEFANQKQESLLHFISHEIKGYLTEGQNAFAGIVEGDFGEPAPKVREISQTALTKMRQGVATVMNILDASNFKKGTVAYKQETCDFREAVIAEVAKLKPKASEKGLALDLAIDDSKQYGCIGDITKISEHVIRNLIDNSIRYTPKGGIRVTLSHDGNMMRFSVKDTGVGITPEDMRRLFTEGGHGKDSIKVNVDSTGYGLFIAKQVVEAHGGKIWAESEGAGKGSEFVVELPTN
jgi:signal transduction histidine kinase